jgi:hypothetical protein
MVWRFAPTYERLQEVGFAAVIRLGRHLLVPVSAPDLGVAPFAPGRGSSDLPGILPQRTGMPPRSPEKPLAMARGSVSGVPDSHSHLDTREGVSASSKRAASRRPACGLDGIRRLASLPSGHGTSARDRRNRSQQR